MTTAAEVKEALKQVIDPELGYNIVDLGLVYDVDVDCDLVRILLTTTTKGCPATEFIRSGVEDCAAGVAAKVEVTMTWDPPWTPEKMSDMAKEHFGVSTERTSAWR
ncbi:MAG: metal-sulfur cluster assembly factor [Alphaproteobacteria bacterium]|nr:metal-sulfur cluster assembly factor [Alphaproteobacteria bacterium]